MSILGLNISVTNNDDESQNKGPGHIGSLSLKFRASPPKGVAMLSY
jgi:hypothetical protein